MLRPVRRKDCQLMVALFVGQFAKPRVSVKVVILVLLCRSQWATYMKILFLHGFGGRPGGIKPTYLANHGHEVLNPQLSDDDFEESIRIAQAAIQEHRPDVIVGSSRGGGVAVNIDAQGIPLVLVCPSWKNKNMADRVPPNTVILHSRQDELIPFADSEELAAESGLSPESLIEVGSDHRMSDEEPLRAMLRSCEAIVAQAAKDA